MFNVPVPMPLLAPVPRPTYMVSTIASTVPPVKSAMPVDALPVLPV